MKVHIVNSFTTSPKGGNPAGVCVLPEPLRDDDQMQAIAKEMNLSETAFVAPLGGAWNIRWFTPTTEVALCGHATLASAHVMWEQGVVETREITFRSQSGPLLATHGADGWINLDFPAKPTEPIPEPDGLADALGVHAEEWLKADFCTVVVLGSPESVCEATPDLDRLMEIGHGEVLLTARDVDVFDFVSRFFAPGCGIPEDPVTGSAHCVLAPLWHERLGKNPLLGHQCSPRGGVVRVCHQGDRVILGGEAISVGVVEVTT